MNVKQIASNIDKMNRKMRVLGREIFIDIADSKSWNTTPKDQLPGRIMSAIRGKATSLIDKKTITKGRLGNWIAIKINYNRKILAIINFYQIL